MNIKKSIIIVALIVIFAGGGGVLLMRKDMPYDFEVVPTDKGLRIVNTTPWADRDCQVSLKGSSGSRLVDLPANNKYALIEGLLNGAKYTLTVRRKDLIGRIRYRGKQLEGTPRDISRYVVLFGASIGNDWNLRELGSRKKTDDVFWGYRGLFEYDKGPLVDSIISSPVKPDVVVIKECAAYFPRDTGKALTKLFSDVVKLKKNGIDVVLATTVPVTAGRTSKNPEQMVSVNAFNEALRRMADEKGVPVLDLQAALSDSSGEGYLADQFAAEDGLHLKKNAYQQVLDNLIVDFFTSKSSKQTNK